MQFFWFCSILLHQWQYYFNISVIQKFESSNEEDLVQHKDELVNILEIFGHALLQSDVNIFRQSLQSLEQLNSKWGLYKRDIFKNRLLHRFVSTLFTILLQRWEEDYIMFFTVYRIKIVEKIYVRNTQIEWKIYSCFRFNLSKFRLLQKNSFDLKIKFISWEKNF